MSVTDHPKSYYEQNDITDPTPYEHDDFIHEGWRCPICGKCFREGESIYYFENREMYLDLLVHGACFTMKWPKGFTEREIVLNALDDLGFEGTDELGWGID